MSETSPVARNHRRTLIGVVESARMRKTVKVTIVSQYKYPKYEKRVRRQRTYIVHDGNGEAKAGDMVAIMETRKLSKTKNWRLVKVLKRVE